MHVQNFQTCMQVLDFASFLYVPLLKILTLLQRVAWRLKAMCDLDSDLRGLPPVECCIRYGSSFFNQHVYDPSKTNATSQLPAKNSYGVQVQNQALSRFISCTTMKDFLFLVPSARLPAWHRANLLSNPDHYTSAIRLIAKLRGVEAATRTVLQLTHMSEIPIFFNCGVHIKGNNEDVGILRVVWLVSCVGVSSSA